MDSYMLMMAKMRGEELMREARHCRRAAEARRAARTHQAARTRQTVAAARGLVIRPAHRLAVKAARMRPTAMGR
jgi:hypothetical protein